MSQHRKKGSAVFILSVRCPIPANSQALVCVSQNKPTEIRADPYYSWLLPDCFLVHWHALMVFFVCVYMCVVKFCFESLPARILNIKNVCKAGWLLAFWTTRFVFTYEPSFAPHGPATNSEFVCSKSSQLVCGIADEIVRPQRPTPRSVTDPLPHATASPAVSLARRESRSPLRGSQNTETFCFHYHNRMAHSFGM